MTPLAGILFLLTFDHSWWPGTARSRLNANSMRDALVWHAVVQKNWPAVEISSTMPTHCGVQRLVEDHGDRAAACGHRVGVLDGEQEASAAGSSRRSPE